MRTKGALGRKPSKTKRLNVRLEDWQLEQIKVYAEYLQVSMSDLVIKGAEYYYQRQKEIDDKIMDEVMDDVYII